MRDEIRRIYELKDANEPERAERIASDLLNQNPRDTEALFAFGMVMLVCERFGIANAMFARVMELVPQQWEAQVNYALTLISMNEFEESERILQQVLKRIPDSTSALNNLALLEVCMARPDKAIEYAQRSIDLKRDQPEPWETLGYANLMCGRFREGWVGYEAMLNAHKYRMVKPLGNEPYWKGEKGGRLYVKGEQGVGDEVSFASILTDAARDNEVILDCDPKLAGLFRRSFPGIEVHGTRRNPKKPWKDWRQIDYGCLIGSLAFHYRSDEKAFSGQPYLVADPERRVQWRALLDSLPGKKVGIAWTGGLNSTFTQRRSLSLEALLPILRTEDISWVSLQYRDPTGEISRFSRRNGIKVHHWARAAESEDYDEQAALVSELDAVVSVTTAVVHLCGALGKQAFVLVPSKPRWFYQLSGATLPWYESVRLYRQSDRWPMESVRDALVKHLKLEARELEAA